MIDVTQSTSALITLLNVKGFGLANVLAVARVFNPAWQGDIRDGLRRAGVRESLVPATSAIESAAGETERLLERCIVHGIRVIGYHDQNYPARLRQLSDFPVVLYVRGDVNAVLSKKAIAVVGTRRASYLGALIAKKIARVLSESGIIVVSGLALGIDTAAHRGALDAGGITWAVMAHGLDVVTPAQNTTLADEILSKGGALISEYSPGTPPRPRQFVFRNRIQSGISASSVIVESGRAGGAVHQANYTVRQGRNLMVVLPRAELLEQHEYNVEGSRHLLDEYSFAWRISSTEDLVRAVSEGVAEFNVQSQAKIGDELF